MGTVDETWIRRNLSRRSPDLAGLCLRGLEAFRRALQNGRFSGEGADVLMACVRSDDSVVRDIGVMLLGELANKFEVARASLRELTIAKSAATRRLSISSLSNATLYGFRREILIKMLKDRAFANRELAVDRAVVFGMRDMVGELELAAEAETSASRKAWLHEMAQILEHGYAVRKNGSEFLVIGREGSGLISKSFSEHQFAEEGATWIKQLGYKAL